MGYLSSVQKSGIYIHIPFCLQQCHYCDFATVLRDDPGKMNAYVSMVLQEIRNRNEGVPFRKISTLYFGGGTPSLLSPTQLGAIIQELKNCGFDFSSIEELTLEINPGTITEASLQELLQIGVTRFSVGAQTFDENLLKLIGREHSAKQTYETLKMLSRHRVNYTVDVLFGLPTQTLAGLEHDLGIVSDLNPPHVSAYALTVPDKHPMSRGRAPEEQQVEMFYLVDRSLQAIGLERYEISNYTAPGKESRHNLLYWQDGEYWGLGMSAHSYFKQGDWGVRFWNPPHITAYSKQVQNPEITGAEFFERLPEHLREKLALHQSLTDFCHTSLRTLYGLDEAALQRKYPKTASELAVDRLKKLEKLDLVERYGGSHWRIQQKALIVSDRVYQEMTFLASDL